MVNRNTTSRRHVIVIGAGIIGASLAYHLVKQGAKVSILDAEGPASGASGASDGAVSVATKSAGLMMDLARKSKAYYTQLSTVSAPLHGVYHSRPSYLVAADETEAEALLKQAEALSQAGVPIQTLRGNALRTAFPDLSPNIPLALEVKEEGHALGYQVVERFLQASQAQVLRRTPVTGLKICQNTNRCVGVQLGDAELPADDVIVASGLGSNSLMPWLKLYPRRGQVIVTDRSTHCERLPGHTLSATYLLEKKTRKGSEAADFNAAFGGALCVDPLLTGQILIGSTREPDANVDHTEFQVISSMLKKALRYFPCLADIDVIRVFAGIRAATNDGIPVIGPVEETPGLWVATGFEGDGICLAPLVGRELAGSIMGEALPVEFQQLSPNRFALRERAS